MSKKILYIVIIVIIIVAGIFVAKRISDNNSSQQTVANTLENTNKMENQNVEENNITEPEENKMEENEVVDNNLSENPEEKAKQIVMQNWGEDDSVYYSYDGKDENGKYIICVREKSTTKALYWYYVDVETGSFDIR